MDKYPQEALQFLDELNRYRNALQGCIQGKQRCEVKRIFEILLQLQVLLHEKGHTIDVQEILQENTTNLVTLLNHFRKMGKDEDEGEKKKYNAKWKKKKNCSVGDNNMREVEKEANFLTNFQLKKPKEEPPKSRPPVPTPSVEFVSANTLPKAKSMRKKFVPPMKKEENKEKEGGKDEEGFDVRYKGLESKLVQIIESEILDHDKKVTWSQIAGLGFAKKVIHEMIVWPMQRPDIFTGIRAPPKGILLFGPPGTGKTMIGRAIASEAKATFFSISASSLTSKWVGESEKLVKTLFSVARHKQPSVIFIDEIDSLLTARSEGEQQTSRRVKNEFLVELDGAKTNANERILVIGATNLPQQLDDAARRRFVKRLYIPLPNFEGRVQLFSTLTNTADFDINAGEIQELSKITRGFSGADIYNLCSEAALFPLREISSIADIKTGEVPATRLHHLQQAMQFVRPSVNQKLLESFQQWNEAYGSYQLNDTDCDQF